MYLKFFKEKSAVTSYDTAYVNEQRKMELTLCGFHFLLDIAP